MNYDLNVDLSDLFPFVFELTITDPARLLSAIHDQQIILPLSFRSLDVRQKTLQLRLQNATTKSTEKLRATHDLNDTIAELALTTELYRRVSILIYEVTKASLQPSDTQSRGIFLSRESSEVVLRRDYLHELFDLRNPLRIEDRLPQECWDAGFEVLSIGLESPIRVRAIIKKISLSLIFSVHVTVINEPPQPIPPPPTHTTNETPLKSPQERCREALSAASTYVDKAYGVKIVCQNPGRKTSHPEANIRRSKQKKIYDELSSDVSLGETQHFVAYLLQLGYIDAADPNGVTPSLQDAARHFAVDKKLDPTGNFKAVDFKLALSKAVAENDYPPELDN